MKTNIHSVKFITFINKQKTLTRSQITNYYRKKTSSFMGLSTAQDLDARIM